MLNRLLFYTFIFCLFSIGHLYADDGSKLWLKYDCVQTAPYLHSAILKEMLQQLHTLSFSMHGEK